MTEKKKLYYIIFLLCLTFAVTSFNVIQFFFERASFQYSDWLINYQAGFIRRGFIGEIFYQLSNLFKLQLDYLILFFVLGLYLVFYLNFFKIIKKINLKLIDFFIILSPLSFFYTAFEQKASGRKEIIFLSLLSLFIILLKKTPLNKQVYLMILLTTITSLTHSGLIFYNIYFLVLFIIVNIKKIGIHKIIFKSVPFLLSSLIILILISLNSTLTENELKILCQSVIEYLPNCGKGDYVNTLTWGLKNNFEGNKYFWFSTSYFISYFLSFIFCFIFFLYLTAKTKINNFNFSYVIIICLASSFPLYFIGADYGRYLHISYISSILIYYYLLGEGLIKREKISIKLRKFILIPIILIYSFTWTVPHCCESKPKFNFRKLID